MREIINKLGVLILVAIVASSCVTKRGLTYLREITPESADSINKHFVPSAEITIKPADALTIFVSALDQDAVAPYNLPTVSFNDPTSTQVKTTPMLLTYRVDEEGNIEMPVLGKLHVAGLVRAEAEELIRSALEKHVMKPMVQVNLVSAKVSVLGEVARPGTVNISNGRLTVLEALAAVGDMTPYGRRDNLLISREVNGKMEFARLDLTKDNLLTSPYYYLQQNDVIYVSPNGVRAINSTNVGLWLSTVSTLASAATVIVTILNFSQKSNSSSTPSSGK
jgi:polysaccharide export outer membrane protein